MKGLRNIQAALWMIPAVAILAGCVHPYGSTETGAALGRLPRPEAAAVWEFVTKVDPYRNWSLYPLKEGQYPFMRRELIPAKNPHGAYLKLYANIAAHQAAKEAEHEPMPDCAILVMEDYDKDKETLKSVTLMYKVKGYNPAAGDWFWGSYRSDGGVIASGKAASCIECHETQYRHDWRFTGATPRH